MHDDPHRARPSEQGGRLEGVGGGAAREHATSPDDAARRVTSRIKVITYTAIGLTSLAGAVITAWLAVGNLRDGHLAAGIGTLAYLPMFTAGMGAAGEQFLRGDGSRTAFQMLPLLLVGIVLSALSYILL